MIGAVVLIVVVLLIAVIKTRNSFVTLHNQVKNQFAQIDVQLKRRYDLPPIRWNRPKAAPILSGARWRPW